MKKKPRSDKSLREIRTTLQGSQLEIREAEGQKKLAGYAVVFDTPTFIGSRDYIETITPGSFTRTLAEEDQLLLRDHNAERLLARRSAGTLTLKQDKIGVAFEAVLPDTELGRDTYENVRLGNLRGCSFGFRVRDQDWDFDADGNLTRLIKDVQCYEFTITPWPAYDDTSVDVRSIRAKLSAKRDDGDGDEDDDPCDPDIDDCGGDEVRCTCQCGACQDGDCSDCDDPECDDDDCEDCPMQDDARSDSLRVRQLFDHRMNAV